MVLSLFSFVITILLGGCLVMAADAIKRRGLFRQAETARREVAIERKFRRMIENADDAIFSLTSRGMIVTWNPGAERLTGYTAYEAIGSNVARMVTADCISDLPRLLRRIALGGHRELSEIGIERRDGSRIDVEVSAWKGRDGSRPVIEAIARDVSARKRVEHELKEAKERAEEATRAKSEFLANISHEIRTPLNGVLGMNTLLLESHLTEEQRQYAGTVRSCGTSLLTLLNNILDYSKIEAKKLGIEKIPFQPRAEIEDVARLFSVPAAEKGLALSAVFTGCATDFTVTGDPTRLRQIVANYVNNAIKFTANGSVRIETALTRGVSPGATLKITVQDTGIGISSAEIARLFQKFEQADSATTRRFGGTGLGLAICKEIAELMGGSVGVVSEPGEGAAFWVTVPIEIPPEKPESPEGIVLLVEDNLTNLKVAAAMLRKRGFAVETAADGEQAVLKSRDGYDAIFMDCQMPVMDGYEATRRIRQAEPPGNRRPIIALTANASMEDRQRCFDAGMDDYLTKPIDGGELDRVLAAIHVASARTASIETRAAAADETRAAAADETRAARADETRAARAD